MLYLCTLDYSSLGAGRVAGRCYPRLQSHVVPSPSTTTSECQPNPSHPHQPRQGLRFPGRGQRPPQPHTL